MGLAGVRGCTPRGQSPQRTSAPDSTQPSRPEDAAVGTRASSLWAEDMPLSGQSTLRSGQRRGQRIREEGSRDRVHDPPGGDRGSWGSWRVPGSTLHVHGPIQRGGLHSPQSSPPLPSAVPPACPLSAGHDLSALPSGPWAWLSPPPLAAFRLGSAPSTRRRTLPPGLCLFFTSLALSVSLWLFPPA